jgi:ferric-dicitrate binding protein FerR (iron transport regulator)
VAAGFFIANHGNRFATQGNDAQIAAANKAKATLTLADGKVIVIDDYCGAFVEEQGRAIKIGQGNLEYTTDGESGQPSGETQSVFHEISIPVGSDYRITLSDGSVVWLNSGTRLRYPMTFPSGERRLALAAGEAYFEVEADAARPFVVESRWQSVTVLGTSFNLSAYPDDGNVVTTLSEGSVRIDAADGRQVTLEPGQQARLDMASGRVSLQRVDAWQVAEWRNGYIVIEDLTLEQVMERISRWSGMEYRIAADVPRDIVFRGILRKYDLATTLEKFGMISNLKVELDGNIVTVRQ